MSIRRAAHVHRAFAGALILVLTAVPARAGKGDGKDELPHPGQHLKEVLKNVAKLESCAVSLRIEGGISDDERHSVKQATVRQTYSGEVFGNKLMHLPGLEVYRTPEKGVKLSGGLWKDVMADRSGLLLARLFDFPLDVVKKAYAHSKNAEWVGGWVTEEEDAVVEEGDVPDLLRELTVELELEGFDLDGSDESKDEPAGQVKSDGKSEDDKGKTVVAGSVDAKEPARKLPKVIRVEAPTREALQHFLAVEKSGCIGGG